MAGGLTQKMQSASPTKATDCAPLSAKAVKYRRRQREIFDTAAAVFADKGYHGASTSDIADRLGIKQGSLYYYFRSKEEALEQVCLIGVQGFVQRIEKIAGTEADAPTKIRAVITGHLNAFATKPDYTTVFLNDRQYLPRDRGTDISAQSRRYERTLEAILASGSAVGELRADLDCRTAALAILGTCNAVRLWPEIGTAMGIDTVADTIASLFIDGLRSPAPTSISNPSSAGDDRP